MGKINILHIYQNSKVGGVQQQLLSLLKAYNREVFNPIFCCLGPKEEVGKEIENLGIDFIALNRKRYHRFSLKIIINLYRLMKKKHIHVVRTHKYRASLYGRIAAWLAGVPVIITSVHGNYRKDLRLERRIANKIMSKITDKIVAVSESIKKDIVKHDKINPSKIVVIHNGVDILRFNPENIFLNVRGELSINDNDVVVGFVGRLVPAKGLQYLIEAISIIQLKVENIKLLIVGEGSLIYSLKNKARELGIKESVIFTGKRRDIPEVLSCIDIFVMPSVAEGLPNSLLEAMAMGKPIVATTVGGIPEIIENEINGLIISPEDPESLASAIKFFIGNKGLAEKLGQAAKEFVLRKYSIKAIAVQWECLYKSLLKEKGFINVKEMQEKCRV